ncbi:dihydrolipoamide acetyltransferase family protein [Salimicrobium salexigens]|uniref:Dihydrolipoamide acetyltransferase component of pyruvate dehydrogenase complex n=1 Tax=Salimicrobium salexigens TaxID=908941 RepID=A0ABY1KNR2_9BACI|nr:dihydrolipoamide acetyltransferase family protein [Salimicrobium salexigens]SIS54559.1 branched-chain alpha-keto acid dehydrogenase E2 component [Salimicrobium salexigens]
MAIEKINMPQLGESVTEGTISTWLVKPGDTVEKYDPIAEVMTDKVNAEVPSSFTGTITELQADEGETIEVGELICYIETEDASGNGSEADSGTDESDKQEETASGKAEAESNKETAAAKPRYSPAVLTLASQYGIDLEDVPGSGKDGRITRKDVEKYQTEGGASKAQKETKQPAGEAKATESRKKKAPVTEVSSDAGDKEIPVTGVRKAIASNMVTSTTEIPHAWMMVEVDVTNLVKLREKNKEAFKKQEGYSLTYFSFFVKAVAQALKEYPELNSQWAGDKIIQKKNINLNIAVAKENELFVPVIKHADELSVKGIARNITDLAAKARKGKLTTEDMQGGTFTVNNTGSFGSVQSMGVINHPQAAILQVESIVKKPVYMDGMFGPRDMVNLCLSLDHRVLDGLIAGNFLQKVKEILENMDENDSVY